MKGIAVRTLVLLTIGVIVVGLVGYLLYRSFVAGGGTVLLEQCKTALIRECRRCETLGWGEGEPSSPPSVCLAGGKNIHTQLGYWEKESWEWCSEIKESCGKLMEAELGV